MTEREAARFLRISVITLKRIRYRGEIASSRVGRNRILYTTKGLTEYLASRERFAVPSNQTAGSQLKAREKMASPTMMNTSDDDSTQNGGAE